ncbi:MAG: ribbon-helix-helix domain-containing protein [Azospirillaceae bacterium]
MADPPASDPPPGPPPDSSGRDPWHHRRRDLTLDGRTVTVALETAVWDALDAAARDGDRTTDALAALVDRARGGGDLATALSVFAVAYWRVRSREGDRTPRPGPSPALTAGLAAVAEAGHDGGGGR